MTLNGVHLDITIGAAGPLWQPFQNYESKVEHLKNS